MEDQNDQLPNGNETDTSSDEQAPPVDEIKNLKSEMGRKFDNLNAQFSTILQTIQAGQQQAAPREPAAPSKELMYDNPEEYTRLIEERATQKAANIVRNELQRDQTTQVKIAEMATEFPEFRDQSGDAYRKAIEIHNTLPANLKGTAEGAELAMQRAANNLGLVPSSRRRTRNNDDFIPPTTNTGRKSQPGKDDVSDDVKQFAQIFAEAAGRDFNDPKLQEGLKNAAKRKDWKRFSGR